MSYRRVFVSRWSTRDRLAVFAIAVAVAFLTGATVLLFAMGTQTAGIAGQYDTPGSAIHIAGETQSTSDAGAILPLASVMSNQSAGRSRLVGVPPDSPLDEASLTDGGGVTLGTRARSRGERLQGPAGTVTVTVAPRASARGLFPRTWYVTDPATARAVGTDGAFLLDADAPVTTDAGVPLLGALAFFLLGTREAIGALGVTAAGAGVLVGVTVYSVSRMSVRDRLAAIRVVRATGGTARTVIGVFTLRAALLTAVGVALGYAGGVIVAHGTVTLAVAVGVPAALPVAVTPRMAGVLVPLYGGLVGLGAVSGAVAAAPVARGPPGAIGQQAVQGGGVAARLPDVLTPRVIGWRALVPTTATVTAFVAFVILVAGLAGAAGPILAGEDVTITAPDSTHPVSSRVPTAYATALTERGIAASGEILLFEVLDGQPYVARGASYPAFANVTDARLTRGRRPAARDEAVVGTGLARTLDVNVGETITLGGSTRAALTRVEIVGTFTAPGPYDDQLLVSLSTARHLAGVGDTQVQFVRAARLPEGTPSRGTVEVTDLTVGGPVVANGSLTARVAVRNLGLATTTENVTVRYRGTSKTRAVRVPATTTRTVTVSFPAGPAGAARLRTGTLTRTVTVRSPAALTVTLPATLPANSEPVVRVRTAAGTPVEGAIVAIANRTRTTASNGRARLPGVPPGEYTVTVTAGERRTTVPVSVEETATRTLDARLTIKPSAPTLLDHPVATVRVSNPWNRTLTRTISLASGEVMVERRVRVAPASSEAVAVRFPRRSPGRYTVAVRSDASESTLASASYRVTGDDRVLAAVASSGRAGTTGIGQAVAVAVGNLQIVLAALIGLAGVMTVGGTTAVFAQAVHARRRTLGVYRATGAAPLRVLRVITRDALLVGSVATVLGLILGHLGVFVAARAGYLTVFGVRLSPTLDVLGVVGALLGGLGITVGGAVVATGPLLGVAPTALLGGARDSESSTTLGESDD